MDTFVQLIPPENEVSDREASCSPELNDRLGNPREGVKSE